MKKRNQTSCLLAIQISLPVFPFSIRSVLLLFTLATVQICQAQTMQDIDSISVALEPRYNAVGKAHRFWFGEGYRELWAVPVRLKVFDFEKTNGGITIQRTGGGLQTKSLHFKDPRGKEWVLRSVQKYPERGLPLYLRSTIVKNILHDQVITSHPYGAITVPVFAKALGIMHSTPRYVFMPDDEALGNYRDEFRNTILLMEERAPEDSATTDNTSHVQKKLQEDNDNKVDQKMVLRARLLDMLLGDWDRHEDQWRWLKRKAGNKLTYLPIPRDRDNVFYNTTGVLPWLVSHQWLMARLQGFKEKIRRVDEFNSNNQYFDRYFLNGLDEKDWEEQIEIIRMTITDDLIRSALRLMPEPVYLLSNEEIEKKLIARRESLKEVALSYYQFLSKTVDIAATDKHELFDIDYKEGGKIDLSIYKTKKTHVKEDRIYHREFDAGVTKEIRLYGLGGQDIFSVSGYESSPIKVRMIGGADVDSFLVNKETKNSRRLLIYDGTDEPNYYPLQGARIKASADSNLNIFDKRSFKYDRSGPIISLFVNLDFGALTTLGWLSEKQGFKKEPYASRQEITGNYSVARHSFNFRYRGDFKKTFGDYDLLVNAVSFGPKNVSNFFSVGNETEFVNPGKEGIEYYRCRYDLVNADVRIKKLVNNHFSWNAGIAAQYYTSSQSDNVSRFLGAYNLQHPSDNVFASRFFAGVCAGLELRNIYGTALQSRGIQFTTDLQAMKEAGGEGKSFGLVLSSFTVNLPLTKNKGIALMNRVGGGATIGNPNFYQMVQLGGVQNLRGFNSRRFTGNTMLYDNLELWVKLFDFSSFLFPGSVGIIGMNDIGRVWVPNQKSTQWHHGYGGGIFIAPADIVLLRLLVGYSAELTHVYFSLGFSF